jgi:hypothetical protein
MEFRDNSIKVTEIIDNKILILLEEVGFLVVDRTVAKSRRRTGQTANNWRYVLNKSKNEVIIGNPLENAIWEEFGTGEYALKGNGRKGGWVYQDKITGKFYHTYGKKPSRAFYHSFKESKSIIQARANVLFKELNNGN